MDVLEHSIYFSILWTIFSAVKNEDSGPKFLAMTFLEAFSLALFILIFVKFLLSVSFIFIININEEINREQALRYQRLMIGPLASIVFVAAVALLGRRRE